MRPVYVVLGKQRNIAPHWRFVYRAITEPLSRFVYRAITVPLG